jgi:hypothetical protein
MWGIDIIGPLQKVLRGFTHLLVAIDKFSKWVEACPITNLRAEWAVSFFTDIVHRFGVPNSIITDNGTHIRAGSSWSSATNTTSAWIGQPSHTHTPTARGVCQRHDSTRPQAQDL